jgi:hypothetical protein
MAGGGGGGGGGGAASALGGGAPQRAQNVWPPARHTPADLCCMFTAWYSCRVPLGAWRCSSRDSVVAVAAQRAGHEPGVDRFSTA